MSDFNHDLKAALKGDSGFDPDRARAAHEEVYRTFNKKLKQSERIMWLLLYLLLAAGVYAALGFMTQATTTRDWIANGVAISTIVVIIIQKTLLHAVKASQLVTMKEMKQLRLAVAGVAIPQDEAAAKPLRGLWFGETIAWILGLIVVSSIVTGLGSLSNRQDDLWRLKAQNEIEAHSVLTLRRFPHEIRAFYGITGPVEGAVLKSASLNGRPVAFDRFANQHTIHLPHKFSFRRDRIELVWSFTLPDLKDYREFRAPLRSIIPVHGYSLIMYVEDDSGFAVPERSWKFNKSPEELKNETEARRTVKLFTQDIQGDVPRDNFGSCGLSIIPRPSR